MKISELIPAPYNPRIIGEKQVNALGYSINEYGDISGIVFNERTGNLVTGHQRTSAIIKKYGDLEIVNDEIVLPTGEHIKIRRVDWDLLKEKAANIAANTPTIQGEFSAEIGNFLREFEVQQPEVFEELLLLTENYEEIVDESVQQDKPVYPIEREFLEQYDYVLIFSNNETDFVALNEILQLKHKQSYKSSRVGRSRIISAKEFLSLWNSK